MSKDTELLANLLLNLAEVIICSACSAAPNNDDGSPRLFGAAWDAFGDMQELIDEAGRADE